LLIGAPAFACSRAVQTVASTQESVVLTSACGTVTLSAWGDAIIRVTEVPAGARQPDNSLIVTGKRPDTKIKVGQAEKTITITTAELKVTVDRADGSIRYQDADGRLYLAETPASTIFAPSESPGLFRARQAFTISDSEAVYGLGQRQTGVLNLRGQSVRLQQANGQTALPMLLSSNGYGILWDNASVTDVTVAIPSVAGRIAFDSEAAKAIDYYFIAGPDSDEVVAGYRRLTGAAPLLPRWAFGFWQSRERYASQDELVGVARKYREMGVPFDVVVQDWQYWKRGEWGAHRFDPGFFPDPKKMVDDLHAMNVHAIVSVWPRFDQGTETRAELERAGGLFPDLYPNVWPVGQGRWYDAFNPTARKLYWRQIADRLGRLGFDGWWLDGSEAELGGEWGQMRKVATAAGPGALVYNAYPLLHTQGVYEGSHRDLPGKRPLILTRSAWAGQQRNGAISWSGDIHGDWETFRRQIPAGLNFTAAGIPYWNTDIGGFFGGDPAEPGYRELFIRWFQYGAFTPIMRVHGTGKPKEIWRFDKEAQEILLRYDRLRYRLLPYIYSLSWAVTDKGSTMMRPLVMDFRSDRAALEIDDQFMFGPGVMVAPVMAPGAQVRTVYLPGDGGWYDFWTGKAFAGKKTIVADAPLAKLPLYVRAGTILPIGPVVQHTGAQSSLPLELRVYPGADGAFTLYDDAGDGPGYERGERATIDIKWNDAKRTLTLSNRRGSFPGMRSERVFKLVWVSEASGQGDSETLAATAVRYVGRSMAIKAPEAVPTGTSVR
jgi:alpha-D-xyloside xylohydrolase